MRMKIARTLEENGWRGCCCCHLCSTGELVRVSQRLLSEELSNRRQTITDFTGRQQARSLAHTAPTPRCQWLHVTDVSSCRFVCCNFPVLRMTLYVKLHVIHRPNLFLSPVSQHRAYTLQWVNHPIISLTPAKRDVNSVENDRLITLITAVN